MIDKAMRAMSLTEAFGGKEVPVLLTGAEPTTPTGRSRRILPMISLHTDKQVIRSTPEVEAIMGQLSRAVGLSSASWDKGGFTVSMQPPHGNNARPKTPSFLTFKNSKVAKTEASPSGTMPPAVAATAASPTSTSRSGSHNHPVNANQPLAAACMKSLSSMQHRLNTPSGPAHLARALSERPSTMSPKTAARPGLANPRPSSRGASAPGEAGSEAANAEAAKPGSVKPDASRPGTSQKSSSGPAPSGLRDSPRVSLSHPGTPVRPNTPAVHKMTLPAPGRPSSRDGIIADSPLSRCSTPGARAARLQAQRRHPMAAFRPSRSHALQVFGHIDNDNNSKVTMSELEDAALGIGFTIDQTRNLFHRLDVTRKGFLTCLDWGHADAYATIQVFTLLYMRRFLGLPSSSASPELVAQYNREMESKKITSLQDAVQRLSYNAIRQGSHSATRCGDAIYDAFKFIDTDGSGKLSRSEIADGFSALGVPVDESVTDSVMELFDADKNGSVDYHEFVTALFGKNGGKK